MRVLVAGAAGFIGSHVVRRLAADGIAVRGLDDFSTGSWSNVADLTIEMIEGDVRDPTACAKACDRVDAVIHLAARNSVPRSLAEPDATVSVNIVGTANLLQAARAAHVRRFVFASSSSVYGDEPGLPRREDLVPAPTSPYAATKLATEALARAWWTSFGLPTIGLRYFNVFGPRQDPDAAYSAVVPCFVRAALRNEAATIHGDGTTSRDFTYVDNAVAATVNALAAPPRANGRVYNVASGRAVALLELHAAIAAAVGTRIAPVHGPRRNGDPLVSVADIRAARHDLGYEPTLGLEEGLRRTVAWYSEVDR